MILRTLKLGAAVTTGAILLGGLLLGRDLVSYVRTGVSNVREEVRSSIPIDVELEHEPTVKATAIIQRGPARLSIGDAWIHEADHGGPRREEDIREELPGDDDAEPAHGGRSP